MKIYLGDTVECEHCTGEVLAITDNFVIIKSDITGTEYPIDRQCEQLWIPIDKDIEKASVKGCIEL